MSSKKEVAVAIKHIHKEFILPQSKNSTFKQTVVNIVKKNKKVTQKVLDGVSFEIDKGDFFGIVGRNGSGKSTLLKLIAGVYTPTAGEIQINGGLTPFIELGVGFNPELSGRDNVYLNGALLGFNRKQMDMMYDEIVDFAELQPFMDQKLKNYSSGMQVRLAFSIAIKAKNEILIFDEVLAVGDEAFQRKCLDIFDDYKAIGQTVILVTHDMATVKKFCNRAVLINEGKVTKIGDPVEVADEYSRLNQIAIDTQTDKRQQAADKLVVKPKVFLNLTKHGAKANSFAVNDIANLEITWDPDVAADRLLVDLYKKSGEQVSNFISSREGVKTLIGKTSAELQITLNLAPGSYYYSIGLWMKDFKRKLASVSPVGEFIVTKDYSQAPHEFAGTTLIEHTWESS